MSALEPTPVTFIEEQTPLGDWVWTLRCGHGEVDSIEVVRTFSPDLILGCYLFWAEDLPSEMPDELVAQVARRTLLGRLAEMKFGCPCGLQPFRLTPPDGAPGVPQC